MAQVKPQDDEDGGQGSGPYQAVGGYRSAGPEFINNAGGGGGGGSEVSDWLRQQGVSEHVINDEAGYLSSKYGADYRNANISNYMTRSASQSAGGQPQGSGSVYGQLNSGNASSRAGVFSDPLTAQYEQLLQAQLGLYQSQQSAMQEAAKAAEARRASTGDAVKRLEAYTNERVGKLQGPAYTGAEAEVLRTQFLDPLERDRGAARKRAMEQISARGMTPDSGIAQELLSLVDREFNTARTQGQGAIATRQIEEQRSREQEAQGLLKYLAMLPDAVARGDMDFVAYVQSLIEKPGQQGLTTGRLLADLPGERLQEGLSALGVGGSGSNNSSQLLQLLYNQQQSRQQQNQLSASAWGNIGLGFG